VADKGFRSAFVATPSELEMVRIEDAGDGRRKLIMLNKEKRTNRMTATDYSSIEMRLAAALGIRTVSALEAIWTPKESDKVVPKNIDPNYTRYIASKMSWITKDKNILRHLIHGEVSDEWPIDKPKMSDGAEMIDFAQYYARELVTLKNNIYVVNKGKLLLAESYRNNVDPHLLTGLSINQRKPSAIDIHGMTPYEYLAMLAVEDPGKAKELKDTLGLERKAAKAENFGLLYGMSANKLWRYGTVQFGLDWDLIDAEMDRSNWLKMYSEVTLWQAITEMFCKNKANMYVGGFEQTRSKYRGDGKFYENFTLTGRVVVAEKINAILNYQDQGTGAEIALNAISILSNYSYKGGEKKDYNKYLVNFVHDELIYDYPEEMEGEMEWVIEHAMRQSANELVGHRYNLEFEVESSTGDFWIH
jgi:DNA polymerase-1